MVVEPQMAILDLSGKCLGTFLRKSVANYLVVSDVTDGLQTLGLLGRFEIGGWGTFLSVYPLPKVWEPYRQLGEPARVYPGGWLLFLPASALVQTVSVPVLTDHRRPDLDNATAALVYSSVPKYRNSDQCPKPGCGRTGYFKQMALCCDVHGAFHA